MKVRYTDTAIGEIDEICSYIAQDSPDAAADVAAAIERTVALIGKRPNSAPVVHAGEVRQGWWNDSNIEFFYAIEGREVNIRNVRRTKRSRVWER